MSRRNLKYFHLFAVLAVLGLFTSLVHYHSEGLSCLDHADEMHYVQDESYCPICILISDTGFEASLHFKGFLSPQDLVLDAELSIYNPSVVAFRFGRAPPYLA